MYSPTMMPSMRSRALRRSSSRASSAGTGITAIRTESTLWKCPKCGRVVAWPYDSMADAGNPICCAGDCDEEMEPI